MNVNVGIDIGSTTVKIVVVRDGEIIHKHYERLFSKVREMACELSRAARGLIGEDTPLRCSITGSAGLGVAKAADIDFVQEVFATRKAVGVHVPQADVVIELGGEDAKILFLTNGTEVRMNGSCAGGTGAFIDQMATLLKNVVNTGTGGRARVDGHVIAGKTGTSNDENDAWFVGFSPSLVTGVYVGFDQLQSLGKQEQGGRTAAPIFRYYRSQIEDLYNDQPQDFTMPPGITMQDGLAFQGVPGPGLSAIDNASEDPATGSSTPETPDTSGGGEDLMRQMF